METKKKRTPNLGDLSVAILENWVEKVIGEDGIEAVKEPYNQNQIQQALENALKNTEQRFINEVGDKEISDLVLSLPVADLPSFNDAIWGFYQNPADPNFSQLLWRELSKISSGKFSEKQIEESTNIFIDLMREELVATVPETREALIAIAQLRIEKNTAEISRILERLEYTTFPPTNVIMSNHIIDFEATIAERTKNFVGRGFVFKKIQDYLNAEPSGYFVIKGDPGIGKTALLSQLIKEKNLIHHFNISQNNIRSPQKFITNICAQIIIRYGLNHLSIPDEDKLTDSIFLLKCLNAAANAARTEKIVIALDSLDEADWRSLSPGVNVHYLPKDLPDDVYFIVTTRRDKAIQLEVNRKFEYVIMQDSEANQTDIEQYIRDYCQRERMGSKLVQWAIDPEIFIVKVKDKSQGNFMYLRYVLPALEEGKLVVDGVEQLPSGLENYYLRHWKDMELAVGGTFKETHQLVISVLAVIVEPIPLKGIAEWTELTSGQINGIIDDWEQFLFPETVNSEQRFRIYHATFSEFLGKQVDLQAYRKIVAKAIRGKVKLARETK